MVNPFPLHNLHLPEATVLHHPEADLYTFQAFQTVGRRLKKKPSPGYQENISTLQSLLTLTSAFSTAHP